MPGHDRAPSSFDSFEQAMDDLSRRLSSRRALRESVVARLLQHVATKLGDYLDASLREDSLNTTLWMSLLLIYASPEHRLKPSELSVFMNSSRTNSTRVSRELQRHGFVDRIPDSRDKRQQFLQLTLKGAAFVEHTLPARRDHVRHALDGFSPGEITELERLLHKLLRTLD
jgi:MarR family transcriptional repressor of emrRAB